MHWLWVLFLSCFAIQTAYYLFVFLRGTAKPLPPQQKTQLPPVSVVVAARNEANNMEACVKGILSQTYPNFELVVVDDGSTDGTLHYLNGFSKEDARLRVLHCPRSANSGKKAALAAGIAKAQYEHMVFTDADCVPTDKNWLRHMAGHFSLESRLVLGMGFFRNGTGPVNTIARYDGFFIALMYSAFSRIGQTYMGVGRNLAYTKALFTEVHGFRGHEGLRSGDDDLLVSEAAAFTRPVVAYASKTYSNAPDTWRSLFFQKARHLSTAPRYKVTPAVLLTTFHATHLFFYISAVLLLIGAYMFWGVLVVVIFRLTLHYLVFQTFLRLVGERPGWGTVIGGDVMLPFLNLAFGCFALINRKGEWKNTTEV